MNIRDIIGIRGATFKPKLKEFLPRLVQMERWAEPGARSKFGELDFGPDPRFAGTLLTMLISIRGHIAYCLESGGFRPGLPF